jgi:protein required for attachment to host cells
MTTAWILVANRIGARLFENPGPGQGLRPVRDISHPEGHLRNQDINADKPGRSHDSMQTGGRHAMGKENDPKEQELTRFSRHLAEILEEGRTHNRYARLILVAEPRFLGHLRTALNKKTSGMVSATLDKDLCEISDAELEKRIGEVATL